MSHFLGIGQNLGAISVVAINGRILETFSFNILSVTYICFAIVIVIGTFIIYLGIRKAK